MLTVSHVDIGQSLAKLPVFQVRIDRLFSLYVLFSQCTCKSCDNTLENCFHCFVSFLCKYVRVICEKTKGPFIWKKENNNLRGVVFTDYMLITPPRSLEKIQLFLGLCKDLFLLPGHWLSNLMLTCRAFRDSPTKP